LFFEIFKGIGGFQGYGFGFLAFIEYCCFGFWILFCWHSSDHGGLQVLDLVLQAFIEYWWFSRFWIWLIKRVGFSWISKDRVSTLDCNSISEFIYTRMDMSKIDWLDEEISL
jgi:hypothetical protein